MKLHLTKPLAFFDIESTGVEPARDRIVEISILRVNVDNTTNIHTVRVNPTVAIPYETSLIHGIFDKDVANELTFKEQANTLLQFLTNCDLGGYNCIKFDVPLLIEEFLRAELEFDMTDRRIIDVQNIFHIMEPRTLKAAYKFYCGQELINAHSAEADIKATYDVFLAQLQRYDGVEHTNKAGVTSTPIVNDMQALGEFCKMNNNVDFAGRVILNNSGEEVFNFGKHKGRKVTEVFLNDPGYYSWIMNSDFSLNTKKVLQDIRVRNAFKK
ncbi:MAG: exonuclease domain-containing protein [Bacteroidia bacterium]